MDFEDNNKLFVFDKKEVILIFVFVLVITITSFTLGVRIGKGLSLKADGFTKDDITKTIDLKSVEEEQADSVLSEKQDQNFEGSMESNPEDRTIEKLNELSDPEKLDSEFSEISKEKSSEQDGALENQMPSDVSNLEEKNANQNTMTEEISPKETNEFKGKYTINLASKKTREEAEEYAAPYLASDLEVVINKVTTSKGVWYRVGVGSFASYNDAKSFLEKNPVFFKGKKYWITEIK